MESYKLLRDLIKFNTIQDKENKKIMRKVFNIVLILQKHH